MDNLIFWVGLEYIIILIFVRLLLLLVLFFLFDIECRGLFFDSFCILFLKLVNGLLGLKFFLIIGMNDGEDWNGFGIVICKKLRINV